MRTGLFAAIGAIALCWSFPAMAEVCYAKWSCTGPQCAKVMGGWSGNNGPFSSRGECTAWSKKYISTASCSCTATGAGAGNTVTPSDDPAENAGRIAADMFSRLNPQTNAQAGLAFGASVATGILSAGIAEMMKGPSPQQIRQQQIQEEFARQERARLAREAAEAAARKHQALLSSLGIVAGSAPMALKLENDPNVVLIPGGAKFAVIPGSQLALKLGDADGRAAPPLTPFSQGVSTVAALGADNTLGLKFGDPPAPASSALQQLANSAAQGRDATAASSAGFDSAATRLGGLPPAPPVPEGKPVGPTSDNWRDLKPGQVSRETAERMFGQALEANLSATETAKQEIAKLEQAPQKNEPEIKAAQDKLQRMQEEKKELEIKKQEFVDLSLDSLAADTSGGAAAPGAAPVGDKPQ